MSRQHKTTVDAPPPRSRRPRPRPTWLRVHTPERGIVRDDPHVLASGRTLIGREVEPGAGIPLDDPRASRVHAALHVSARSQRVRITDEDSRNGTWVNGKRVTEAWLEDGDVVRTADSHFMLRMEPFGAPDADVRGLIGTAPALRHVRATVAQVGPHDVTVLIVGESGTGKEVVAAALHEASGRRGAFVPVNCSAIPVELAESQLFGHVAGSFTGARSDHPGFFRAASGGTLFLDEVGELIPIMQPKLLRALEQRAVTPVGATAPVPCDVRIVAATNRDLAAEVERGKFRGDLYARLIELTIELPPLRARREDLLTLLEHGYGAGMPPLEPALVDALFAHAWPYNVREVLAIGRELRVRGDGGPLRVELVAKRLAVALPPSVPITDSVPPADPELVESEVPSAAESVRDRGAPPSRDELEQILRECKGNIRAIARATARSRMQVYRWIEQYGFDLDSYRDK